jgi:hypothetical protein
MEVTVIEHTAARRMSSQWRWWVGVAVFAAAVVIDVIDGPLLKLGTSALLLVACLLGATTHPPRSSTVTLGMVACVASAVVLVLYRLVGPGL